MTGAPLGLPPHIRGCLFDLDGVLTDTARLHAAAWKETFDEYLAERARAAGGAFVPFDADADYAQYVDGRRREDGVRALLAARGLHLPEGDPGDSPFAETIAGLANRKNERVLARLGASGVRAFADAVRYTDAARRHNLRCGVVSSSANCRDALASAGIADRFEVIVDAPAAHRAHLAGKPAPDTYVAGAKALRLAPQQVAVFEDAAAGIAAARTGRFGYVVGIDRGGRAALLAAAGADVVVSSLDELVRPAARVRPTERRRVRRVAR